MPEAKGPILNKTFDDQESFLIVTRLRPRERPFVSIRQQRVTEYCLDEAVRRHRMAKSPAKRTLCEGGNSASRAAVTLTREDVQKLGPHDNALSSEQGVESNEIAPTPRLNTLMQSDDLKVLFPPRDMLNSASELAFMIADSKIGLMSRPSRCLYEDSTQGRPSSITSPERPQRPEGRCGDTGASSEKGDRYLNKPIGDGYTPSHVLNYTSDRVENSTDRETKQRETWQAMHEKLWEYERLEIVRDDRSCSYKTSQHIPLVNRNRESTEKQLQFSSSNNEGVRCTKVVKYRRGSYQTRTAGTRTNHLYKNGRNGRLLRGNSSPSRHVHRKALSKDSACGLEDVDGRHARPRCFAWMKRGTKISVIQPTSPVAQTGTPGEQSSGAQRNSATSGTPGDKIAESKVASPVPPSNDRRSSPQSCTASTCVNRPSFVVPVKASRIPMHVLYKKKFSEQVKYERPRLPPEESQPVGPFNSHERRSPRPSLPVTGPLEETTRNYEETFVGPLEETNETCVVCETREHSTRPTVRFIIPDKVSVSTSSLQSQKTSVQFLQDNVNFQPAVDFAADTITLKSVAGKMRPEAEAVAGDLQSTHKPSFVPMPRSPTYVSKSRKSAAGFGASTRHLRELPESCIIDLSHPFDSSTVGDKHPGGRKVVAHDSVPPGSWLRKLQHDFPEREQGIGSASGTIGAVPCYSSSGSFLSSNSEGFRENLWASRFKRAMRQNSVSLTNSKVDKHKSYLLQLSSSWTQQSNKSTKNETHTVSSPPPQTCQCVHPIRFNPSVDFSRLALPPSLYPQGRIVRESSSFNRPLLNTYKHKPLFSESQSTSTNFPPSLCESRPRTVLTFSAQVPSETRLSVPFFNECVSDIPPSHKDISDFDKADRSDSFSTNVTLQDPLKDTSSENDQPPDPCMNPNKDTDNAKVTPLRGHQRCVISERGKKYSLENSDGQNMDSTILIEESGTAGARLCEDAVSGSLETSDNGKYSCCLDINAGYAEVVRKRSALNACVKRKSLNEPSEQPFQRGLKGLSALHAPVDLKLNMVTNKCSDALSASDADQHEHGNSHETDSTLCCQKARQVSKHNSQPCIKAVRFSVDVEMASDKPYFSHGEIKSQPSGKARNSVEPFLQCAILEALPENSSDGTSARDHPATCLGEEPCLKFGRNSQSNVELLPGNERHINPDKSGNVHDLIPTRSSSDEDNSTESTAVSFHQLDELCIGYVDGAVKTNFQPDSNFEHWPQLFDGVYSSINSLSFPSGPGGERETPKDLNRFADSICLCVKSEESQDEQNELDQASQTLEDVSLLPPVAITRNYQTYEVDAETQFVEAATQVPAVISRNVETNTSQTGKSMLLSSLSFRQLENVIDVPPVSIETDSIGTGTEDFAGSARTCIICNRESTFLVPENPSTHQSTFVDGSTSMSSCNLCFGPVDCLCQRFSNVSTETASRGSDEIQWNGGHTDIERLRSRSSFFKSHCTQLANVCAVAMGPLYEQAIESGHLFDCNARMKKRSESRHAGTPGYSHHICKHEQRGKPARQPVHARHVFVRALRRESDHHPCRLDSRCKGSERTSVQSKEDDEPELIRGDCENPVHACTPPWDTTTEASYYGDPRRSSGCVRLETHDRDSTYQKALKICDVSAPADAPAAIKGRNDMKSSSVDSTSTLRKCRYSKWVEKAKFKPAAFTDLDGTASRSTGKTSTGVSRDYSKSRDKGNLKDTNATKHKAEAGLLHAQLVAENSHLDSSSRCHKYSCSLCKRDWKSKPKKKSILKRTGGTSEAAAAQHSLPGCGGITSSVSTAREPCVRQADHIVPFKHFRQSGKQPCNCEAQEEIHVTFSDKLAEIKTATEISNTQCFEKCQSACKKLRCLQCIKNSISAKTARKPADEKAECETPFQDIFNEHFHSDFEHRKLSVILETSSVDLDRSLSGLNEDERCHVLTADPDFDDCVEANSLSVPSEPPCERRLPKFNFISAHGVDSKEEKNDIVLGFHPAQEYDDDLTPQKASERLVTNDANVDSGGRPFPLDPTATATSLQTEDIGADYKKGCIFTAMKRYMSHRKHRNAVNVEERTCKRCSDHYGRHDLQDSDYCGLHHDFLGTSERWYNGGDPNSLDADFSSYPCDGCLSVTEQEDSCASYRRTSNVVGVAALNPFQRHPAVLYTVSANAEPADNAATPGLRRTTQSRQFDQTLFSADQGHLNIPSPGPPNDETVSRATLEQFVSCFRYPKRDSSPSKTDSSSLNDTRCRGSRASNNRAEINSDNEQHILSEGASSPCLADAFVVCHQTPRSSRRRSAVSTSKRSSHEDIPALETCHMRKLHADHIPLLNTVREESLVPHLHMSSLQWSAVKDRRTRVPNTSPCERCTLPLSDRPYKIIRGPQIREHMFIGIPERERTLCARKYCTCNSGPTESVKTQLHHKTFDGGTCYGATPRTFESQGLFSLAERNLDVERPIDAKRGPRNVKYRRRQWSKRLNR